VKLSSRQRGWLLGMLFVGAAYLAVFGDKTPSASGQSVAEPLAKFVAQVGGQPAAAVPRPPRAGAEVTSAAKAPPALGALVLRDELIRRSPAAPVDLFSTRNWTPLPPPMAAAPEGAPTAPPLPYAYMGKKLEGGQWEVYLARDEMTYIVRQGGSLEGTYSVERIDPPTMTLIYRPLGQTQSLVIGE
jgi:hypothetical protein